MLNSLAAKGVQILSKKG